MSISVVATALKTSTSTTVTLNCAGGGDFSTAPSTGDLMVVAVHYGDNSGIPNFTDPGGWSVIGAHQAESAGVLLRGVNRKFAVASEATYTWTAQANGQLGQGFILLAAVLRNVANPFVLDPFQASNAGQADAANQSTPNSVMAHADSVLVASWGQDASSVDYSSVGAINGVTPTVLFGHISSPSVMSARAALALWLAPGAGTWNGVATEGGTSLGLWGSFVVGVRAAVLGSPQRTLVGIGT